MYTEVTEGIHVKHGSEMSRRIRMTPTEFANLKDRVARNAAQHPHNPCGEITLEGPHGVVKMPNIVIDYDKIRSKGIPISSIHDEITVLIQPLELSPKGWDIIQYQGKQAFLRFDGVIVYSCFGQWAVKTKNPILVVGQTFIGPLMAITLVDEHIPMGELL